MGRFVFANVVQGRFLHRMVGSATGRPPAPARPAAPCLRNPCRKPAGSRRLATPWVLVDDALTLSFRISGAGRRGAGAADEHGVGFGGKNLEDLAGHRVSVRIEALVAHQLDLSPSAIFENSFHQPSP